MIKGKKGDVYELPLKEQCSGGEGKIYTLPDKRVLKLYLDRVLERDGDELESKLNYMVDHPPKGDAVQFIAWPLDVVYEDGRFRGFVMNNLSDYEGLRKMYWPPDANDDPMSFKHQLDHLIGGTDL